MRARTGVWRFLVVGLFAAPALTVGATATASTADDTILNQTQATDPIGDSGAGPDLSGLTVTTYADGTVSFEVRFANRTFLHAQETVQIFIDLNGDGTTNLNLSVWPDFEPSYLARWTGTDWMNIRQLPELVQTSGSISVRLSLSELQSAAAVPVAPSILVSAASATEDANGRPRDSADDWIPTPDGWIAHSVQPPTTPPETGTDTTTTTTTPGGATTSSPAPAKTAPPVLITPLTPLKVKLGKKATLHIALRSRAGPLRLFKVCAHAPAALELAHPTQCHSLRSTGAKGPIRFTIAYRMTRVGTIRITIDARAGTATATATAIIHVSRA